MEKDEKIINIGKINLTGEAVISDPIYYYGIWCQARFPVVSGNYVCYLKKKHVPGWGERIVELVAKHENYPSIEAFYFLGDEIGVDSAKAGIFDGKYFKAKKDLNDDIWLNDISEEIINKDYGNFDDSCVVCTSGKGDGGYPLYVGYNDEGRIVTLRLVFFPW